jgi:hypothetical protein
MPSATSSARAHCRGRISAEASAIPKVAASHRHREARGLEEYLQLIVRQLMPFDHVQGHVGLQ